MKKTMFGPLVVIDENNEMHLGPETMIEIEPLVYGATSLLDLKDYNRWDYAVFLEAHKDRQNKFLEDSLTLMKGE